MSDNKKQCDNHPDRRAVIFYGHDAIGGDGISYYKVTKRLCVECDKEHRKKNFVVERT